MRTFPRHQVKQEMPWGCIRTSRTGSIADLPCFDHAVGVIEAVIAEQGLDRSLSDLMLSCFGSLEEKIGSFCARLRMLKRAPLTKIFSPGGAACTMGCFLLADR
jgi:hypothetical protein